CRKNSVDAEWGTFSTCPAFPGHVENVPHSYTVPRLRHGVTRAIAIMPLARPTTTWRPSGLKATHCGSPRAPQSRAGTPLPVGPASQRRTVPSDEAVATRLPPG